MRTRLWCVAVALVSSSAVAAGQTVLSEEDALARLSPDSPRVRAIRSATDVARAEVGAAGRWPNPRLNVERESVAGVAESMTTVLQPLPLTGRRGLERRAASVLAVAAERRADAGVRRARAGLRLAFTDLVAAQARERELTATRDRLQALVETIRLREAAGDVAGFDRLRAEREVLEVETDRSVAAGQRMRAQGDLAGFFAGAVDPSGLVAAGGGTSARAEIPPVDVLMTRAEGSLGELLAVRQEAESARMLSRAADRRRIPEPELLAGTKTSSVAGGDAGSVIGVQVVLPIFDRGAPERAIAAARVAEADARAEAILTETRASLAGVRADVLERRAAADRYRASAAAGDIERIAQVSYDAGERGILELLDAHRVSASARIRQVLLDTAARQAEIELELVSGWEIP